MSPPGPHTIDLLRQQSENSFSRSKIQSYMRFPAVFLVFRTFLILDGFGLVGLSISTPWIDFLPGDGLGSPESRFPEFPL